MAAFRASDRERSSERRDIDMPERNLQVTLKSRPQGWVRESDFELLETPLPTIGAGEALLRTLYLSLDPYMRSRMDDAKSYAKNVDIGGVMVGGTVSEVVASNIDGLVPGEIVVSSAGWQQFSKTTGENLMRVPPGFPPSIFLGPAGMPGVTAWIGLFDIGQPKPGETVVVSGAAGAVGQTVGQLAKIKGCRAVGIAGGPAKCEWVVKELGFDACIDYKAGPVKDGLKAHCPAGVDVYFDNVGGEILDAVLTRINRKARIIICGAISQYNATAKPVGPANYLSLLVNRARMEGMVVFDYAPRYGEAVAELAGYLKDGRMKSREDVVEGGVAAFPEALTMLFSGRNFGKLVLLADS